LLVNKNLFNRAKTNEQKQKQPKGLKQCNKVPFRIKNFKKSTNLMARTYQSIKLRAPQRHFPYFWWRWKRVYRPCWNQ